MKAVTLWFLSLLTFAVAAQAAETEPYRVFTDTEGRSIRAVIVRAAEDEVWLRRDDGRTFRVSISVFTETDRSFIQKWRVLDALKLPDALEFAVTRYSGEEKSRATERRKTTFENHGYVVTLRNQTAFDLEKLEIEYRYYVLRDSTYISQPEPERDRYLGRLLVPILSAWEEKEFTTPPVQLKSTSLRANRTGDQRRTSDELDGIWIRIRYEQKVVAEFSKPSDLKEEENW